MIRVRPERERTDDKAITVYRMTDHHDPSRADSGCGDFGGVPQARRQLGDVLQVEGHVRRTGGVGGQAAEGAQGRERAAEPKAGAAKRMLADAMLDNVALNDLLGKNGDARRPSGGCGVCALDSTARAQTKGLWRRRRYIAPRETPETARESHLIPDVPG